MTEELEKIANDTKIKKLSREELYYAIDSYGADDWVNSPEFIELINRLNTIDIKKLKKEGYWIPNRRIIKDL